MNMSRRELAISSMNLEITPFVKIPNIAPNVMCYPDQETSIANVVIMFMIQEEEMIKLK